VWLLTRACRSKPASTRHALWLLASLKFLLPFDLLVNVCRGLAPAVPAVPTILGPVFDTVTAPLQPGRVFVQTQFTGQPDDMAVPLGSIFVVVWAVGTLAMGLRWLAGWLRLRRLVRGQRGGHERIRIKTVVDRIASRMKVSAPDVAVSAESVEPGIFGIIHPMLLWPRDLMNRLTEAEAEAVVAHELCHVRRRDNLTGAAHELVQALFWFHPLLPTVGRRLHREREQACDEEVLLSGHLRRTYAESIVKTCEFCTLAPQGALVGATGHLRDRIVAILGHEAPRRQSVRTPLLTAGVFLLLAPVAFGALRPPRPAPPPRMVSVLPGLRVQPPPPPTGGPSFDVVSVKRNTGSDLARRFEATPGGVNLINLTLRELIYLAYQTQDRLLVGGPAWMNDARFDIVATTADGAAQAPILTLVRQLLADRFHLVMHREVREMPIYELQLLRGDGRLGRGLIPTTCVTSAPGAAIATPLLANGRFPCGVHRFAPGHILLTGASLDSLANRLGSQTQVDRGVVNATGLDGQYDIEVTFESGTPAQDGGALSVFAAVQEDLGLRLTPAKGRVDVLVVDSVDAPPSD
jgi:uncharacterized protein (TIGR03435 family)